MAAHIGQTLVFNMENIPPKPSFQTTPSNSTHCYTFSTPLPTSRIGSSQAWTHSPSLPPKRKKTAQPFLDVLPATLNADEPPAKKRKYRPRKSMPEELAGIFTALQEVDWTLGDFLYFTFQTKDRDGKDLKCSTQHAMYATNFLQGCTTYSPSVILELWFCSPDGWVPVEISHDVPMYSLEHVYTSIKPA